MPMVAPVCGVLRGAGDEKAGRCFCAVFEDGVGVAIVVAGKIASLKLCAGYRGKERDRRAFCLWCHVGGLAGRGGEQGQRQ